jgi:hypothetical protein
VGCSLCDGCGKEKNPSSFLLVSHIMVVVVIYREEFEGKCNSGMKNGPSCGEMAEYFPQSNKTLVSWDVISCSLV